MRASNRPQAEAFAQETAALDALLRDLAPEDYARATQFRGWTIDDVVGHLHFWNRAALLAVTDEPALEAVLGEVVAALRGGGALRAVEDARLGDARGPARRAAWRSLADEVAESYAASDPATRVRWAGPRMSARSAITARQMETWAHGQAIHDLLGVQRQDTDRLRNIAELGVRTFAWTFQNRGEPVPGAPPRVCLGSPSGDTWVWRRDSTAGEIRGPATAFCQVVTQVRNVADTPLSVTGAIAEQWMARAQCFAGPPVDPPAPGTRYRSQ